MFKYFNSHPEDKTSESTTRAVSKLFGCSWTIARYFLSVLALDMQESPDSIAVFDKLMKDNDYRKCVITNDKGDCYTIKDFCNEHKHGHFAVFYNGGIVPIIDGHYYAPFDCGNEIAIIFWLKE